MMKLLRIHFILTAFIFFTVNALAIDRNVTEKRPVLSIPAPSFNFGRVKQGEIVTHQFILKNVGNSDLALLRVMPGCGCTATEVTKKSIKPGEESKIKVDFNTSGFLGKKTRNVSIETNDPKIPVAVLTLQGIIETDVTVKPKALSFGNIKQGHSAKAELAITIDPSSKTKIAHVTTKSQYLNVTKVKEEKGKIVYSVEVSSDARTGNLRSLISIGLSDKGNTSISVPVFASIN